MTTKLPHGFYDHFLKVAEENGRLIADLTVCRAELSVERAKVGEMEAELRALRARIATKSTEEAIAEAYSADLSRAVPGLGSQARN